METGITFAHYGEERDVNPTEGEIKIHEYILSFLHSHGVNTGELRLARVSDSYVSLKLGEQDIARFKWTDRAKWIQLPYSADDSGKRYIESIEEVTDMDTLILGHYFLAIGNKLLGY